MFAAFVTDYCIVLLDLWPFIQSVARMAIELFRSLFAFNVFYKNALKCLLIIFLSILIVYSHL